MTKPFIKWVGGKRQILDQLYGQVPTSHRKYFEPFLGGGALFWKLNNRHATLSDTNLELIQAYRAVREDVTGLRDILDQLVQEAQQDPQAHYYEVRQTIQKTPLATAARFIYLNKQGFNGLYRVNRDGKFNVPWGKKLRPCYDWENLKECSKTLQGVTLLHCDFQEATQDAAEGDFVYFDPPYVPLKADSFTAYTEEGFGPQDQVNLRDHALALKAKGVHVMLSNSGAVFVEELYKNFTLTPVLARRNVNSDGAARGLIKEYLIT